MSATIEAMIACGSYDIVRDVMLPTSGNVRVQSLQLLCARTFVPKVRSDIMAIFPATGQEPIVWGIAERVMDPVALEAIEQVITLQGVVSTRIVPADESGDIVIYPKEVDLRRVLVALQRPDCQLTFEKSKLSKGPYHTSEFRLGIIPTGDSRIEVRVDFGSPMTPDAMEVSCPVYLILGPQGVLALHHLMKEKLVRINMDIKYRQMLGDAAAKIANKVSLWGKHPTLCETFEDVQGSMSTVGLNLYVPPGHVLFKRNGKLELINVRLMDLM